MSAATPDGAHTISWRNRDSSGDECLGRGLLGASFKPCDLSSSGRLVLPTGKDKLIITERLGRLSKQRPTNLGFRCQEPQVMQVA